MRPGRVLMGVLYLTAGACHFILTSAYIRIMPSYLPAHRELVLLSGAAEMAGGLGILIPQPAAPPPGEFSCSSSPSSPQTSGWPSTPTASPPSPSGSSGSDSPSNSPSSGGPGATPSRKPTSFA